MLIAKLHKPTFILLLTLCMTPFIGAGSALVLGAIFAITLGNPFSELSQKASKVMLKLAVVGLGFAVDFNEVIEVKNYCENKPLTARLWQNNELKVDSSGNSLEMP